MKVSANVLEHMKREILEHGVGALKAKGISVRVVKSDSHGATVAIEIVDQKNIPLVEVAVCRLDTNESLIVFEIEESFNFTVT